MDIGEVNSRMVPHAMHAVKHGALRITVLSPDTHVTILIMYYWNVFYFNGLQELQVKVGVGDSTKYLSACAYS